MFPQIIPFSYSHLPHLYFLPLTKVIALKFHESVTKGFSFCHWLKNVELLAGAFVAACRDKAGT